MSYTQTEAMKRALKWVGKRYRQGYCQYFVVIEVFATGGVGDFDGDKAADAEDGWKAAVARGKVVKAADIKNMNDTPGGLMMYWSGGSHDNGHAATSLPNGKLLTTDKTPGYVGIVQNTWPHTHWGLTFLGYATKDGNGHNLLDKPKPVINPTPEKVSYRVISKTSLNGRDYPATGNVMVSLKTGTTVNSVGSKKLDNGDVWILNDKGFWFLKKYLEVKTATPKPPTTTSPVASEHADSTVTANLITWRLAPTNTKGVGDFQKGPLNYQKRYPILADVIKSYGGAMAVHTQEAAGKTQSAVFDKELGKAMGGTYNDYLAGDMFDISQTVTWAEGVYEIVDKFDLNMKPKEREGDTDCGKRNEDTERWLFLV